MHRLAQNQRKLKNLEKSDNTHRRVLEMWMPWEEVSSAQIGRYRDICYSKVMQLTGER